MKTFFSPSYKIKCTSFVFGNFQMVSLLSGTIMQERLTLPLKNQMLKLNDMKSFRRLYRKVHPLEDVEIEIDKTTVRVTVEEISAYLCLANFTSKIGDSKYFILLKREFPNWGDHMIGGLESAIVEGSPYLIKMKTIEGFTDSFARDVAVLTRFAKIKFHSKSNFINRINAAINYTLK